MSACHDVSVLRAHAIAGALRLAKPLPQNSQDFFVALDAWTACVRYCAAVVCSAEGVSLVKFSKLCGEDDNG